MTKGSYMPGTMYTRLRRGEELAIWSSSTSSDWMEMGVAALKCPRINGVTSDWKWPYRDSWYFPGAKVAVFAAWAVGVSVLQAGL